MERLFAPWRIDWVRREDPYESSDECIFCAFCALEDDREHLVVARSESAYVLLNNAPYNPGHVMVIPHQHTGRFQALEDDALRAMERLTQRTLEALERAFEPDGFNTGCNLGTAAAGGSIGDHLHRHIVPRWAGDTNFMPVLDETKVIVQALEATYEELHEAFASLDGAERTDQSTAVQLR